MRTWPRQLRALVMKDVRLELRTRETAIAMMLFVVLAMVILQFGFDVGDRQLGQFIGGLLWVPLAFAAVLGVGRSYVAEREQRVLDTLLVAPVSRFVMLLARAIAIVGYLLAVQVIAIPLAGIFFVRGEYWSDIGWLFLAAFLADVGIGILGTLVAAMAVGFHGRPWRRRMGARRRGDHGRRHRRRLLRRSRRRRGRHPEAALPARARRDRVAPRVPRRVHRGARVPAHA